MRFEWDVKKEQINRDKHGVSFAEAVTVFNDAHASIFDDPKHSVDEHREIIIGRSIVDSLLLVSFTERSTALRIISARKANKKERTRYESHQKDGN